MMTVPCGPAGSSLIAADSIGGSAKRNNVRPAWMQSYAVSRFLRRGLGEENAPDSNRLPCAAVLYYNLWS